MSMMRREKYFFGLHSSANSQGDVNEQLNMKRQKDYKSSGKT